MRGVDSFEIPITTIIYASRTHVDDQRLSLSTRPFNNSQWHIRNAKRILRVSHDQTVVPRRNRFEFEAAFFISNGTSNQTLVFLREQS